jgi:hypothetical protein
MALPEHCGRMPGQWRPGRPEEDRTVRHLAAFLGVLAMVAGCASSAGTAPGASTTPGPAVKPVAASAPTAKSIQAPSPSPMAIMARVTFDGRNCVYSGPRLIPSPAVLTIEYAPTPAQLAWGFEWAGHEGGPFVACVV